MIARQPSSLACTSAVHVRPSASVFPGGGSQHPFFAHLQEMFPHIPLSAMADALELKKFDYTQTVEYLLNAGDNGGSSPEGPHSSDAQQQVPTPNIQGHPFPRESVKVDNYNHAKHTATPFDSAPFHHELDAQLLNLTEDCVIERSSTRKCRNWWRRYGAQESPTMPTPVVQGHSVQHYSSSPAVSTNSANQQNSGEACVEAYQGPGHTSAVPSWPDHLAEAVDAAASSLTIHSGIAPSLSEVAHALGNIELNKTSSDPASSHYSADHHSAPVFADDECPEDAHDKLKELEAIFCTLPPSVLANTLREACYNVETASNSCFALLSMEHGTADGAWSDSGSPSEVDTSSIAADSLIEPVSPEKSGSHWPLDDSETLQELDFEEKVAKLHSDFPQVDVTEITGYLSASDGSYDTAYALVLQSVEDFKEQEAARRQREAKDRALALGLQEEESTPKASSTDSTLHNTVHCGQTNPATQDGGSNWLVIKDPSMKPHLDSLQRMFPQIAYGALQNVLAANEGCMNRTVRCLHSQMPETRLPVTPSRKATPAVWRTASAGSSLGPHAGQPITPPPGFGSNAPSYAAAGGRPPKPFKAERNDLYTEARKNFRDAQAQIALCKQEFYAASKVGDWKKQQNATSRLEYWQKKAVEERRKGHKKIFSSKNAEVSNTFKVDLHALHVREALEEIDKTMANLTRFKCTWLVEAITGKGLHSAGQDAKLLPAVKQHLAKKDITFWELPGMVVFKLSPSPDDLY